MSRGSWILALTEDGDIGRVYLCEVSELVPIAAPAEVSGKPLRVRRKLLARNSPLDFRFFIPDSVGSKDYQVWRNNHQNDPVGGNRRNIFPMGSLISSLRLTTPLSLLVMPMVMSCLGLLQDPVGSKGQKKGHLLLLKPLLKAQLGEQWIKACVK
jgi:hypothetical protein